MTSDILQAAVWPYRDIKSPARGKHFYKFQHVFPWKVSQTGPQSYNTLQDPAEMQHHSCELQALFRTTASRTRKL